MKSTWIRGVLGGGVLTAALFISGHALAGVSNPAYYTVNASDMEIYNNTGSVYAIADTGTIEGDLASDGSFAYNASSFAGLGTTSISTMKSKFVIGAGGTSGVIDPFTKEVSFTLHMKIQFSGTGPGGAVSTTCQTSFFNVTISTTKTSTPWASSKFDPSNGGFLAVAQDFTIPQVTAANCGATNANAMNSSTNFNFGAASGGVAIMISGRVDTPQIPLP